PYEITPRNMISRKNFQNFSIFASIHTSISLNQGQGSIFTLQECAQSIFRMIIPNKVIFTKNFFSQMVAKCTTPSLTFCIEILGNQKRLETKKSNITLLSRT